MSALSDLQKKLEQEAQGIMFPFSAKTPTVDTKQEVYNSATDGIMTMQGQKYIGPDAVIQYGTEEQDYQRQLKQIEAPMLPQFDDTQFPKAGEGIVQTPTPTPPPTTGPVQPVEPEQPAFDPCPEGFKYDPQLQRCVPIEKQKSDRQTVASNPPRNIGSTAKALGSVVDAIDKLPGERGEKLAGTYGKPIDLTIDNSTILSKLGPFGKLIDQALIKGPADNRLLKFGEFVDAPNVLDDNNRVKGITVTKNADGTLNVNLTEEGKYNFGLIQTDESLRGNLASTQKTDKQGNIIMGPNNTPMIIGPISVNSFGKTSKEFLTPEQVEKNRQAVENAQKKRDNLELTTVTTRPSLMGQTKDTSKEAREFKERFGKQKSQQQLKQERDKIESDLDDLLKKNITEADRQAAKKTTGSSANKKDKGKIVCTMMNESYGFGSFRNKIWLAQSRNLAKEYEIGYHTLFLPLVKYAKQKGFTNSIVKKVLEHIAIHRTIDIRKQKYNKVDILGRTYRTILEPLCYITGGIKTWKKK